jgi:hypothetical protein
MARCHASRLRGVTRVTPSHARHSTVIGRDYCPRPAPDPPRAEGGRHCMLLLSLRSRRDQCQVGDDEAIARIKQILAE